MANVLSSAARWFADNHHVARLATASSVGEPHVIPFCYARLGDNLYFVVDEKPKASHTGLKRLRNIRENPKVSVVIDDYDDDWTQLAYLLMHGQAIDVDDEAEFDLALRQLRVRYPQYLEMPLAFKTNPMVRIEVTRMHQWQSAKLSNR